MVIVVLVLIVIVIIVVAFNIGNDCYIGNIDNFGNDCFIGNDCYIGNIGNVGNDCCIGNIATKKHAQTYAGVGANRDTNNAKRKRHNQYRPGPKKKLSHQIELLQDRCHSLSWCVYLLTCLHCVSSVLLWRLWRWNLKKKSPAALAVTWGLLHW